MLELVALRLLCAVAQPHIYSETVVIAACAGGGVYRQRKNGEAPRMESTGGRLPCQNEGCRAEKKRAQRKPCRS